MDKYLIIQTLGLVISSGNYADENSDKEVSATVKPIFHQKFSAVKKINWNIEFAPELETEFIYKGKESSANFLTNRIRAKIIYSLQKSGRQDSINQTIIPDSKGFKIEEVQVSEKYSGSFSGFYGTVDSHEFGSGYYFIRAKSKEDLHWI